MKASTKVFGIWGPIIILMLALISMGNHPLTSANVGRWAMMYGYLLVADLLIWGLWRWLVYGYGPNSIGAQGGQRYHQQCKDWMGPVCRDPSWHWAAHQRGRRFPDGTTEFSRNHGVPPSAPFRPGDSSGIGGQGGAL